MEGISVYAGRTPGNTRHGGAGRGCQDPGSGPLRWSQLLLEGISLAGLVSRPSSQAKDPGGAERSQDLWPPAQHVPALVVSRVAGSNPARRAN
jgi:hypothetical protein